MLRTLRSIFVLIVVLAFSACTHDPGAPAENAGALPTIFPDYTEVTVPMALWYFRFPHFLRSIEEEAFWADTPDVTHIMFHWPADWFALLCQYFSQFFASRLCGAALMALGPLLVVLLLDLIVAVWRRHRRSSSSSSFLGNTNLTNPPNPWHKNAFVRFVQFVFPKNQAEHEDEDAPCPTLLKQAYTSSAVARS